MSNLESYKNIYADLAQGSYTGRPLGKSFPPSSLTSKQKEQYDLNKPVLVNFPNAKDAVGNDMSVVYLQSDKTGALTNAKAGYNAYFVTDQPSVSDSQETYFVIDKVKIIQAISFLFTANFQKRAHSIYFVNVFYFWYY